MLTIWPDVEVTRRKRFHFVTDEAGVVLWRGIRLTQLLEFVITTGASEALVRTADAAYHLRLAARPQGNEAPLWPNSPPPF